MRVLLARGWREVDGEGWLEGGGKWVVWLIVGLVWWVGLGLVWGLRGGVGVEVTGRVVRV